MSASAPYIRFREARQRLGMSPNELASMCGISGPAIWDIELHEDELTGCYSPRELQTFCQVLGIRPVELFDGEISEPAVRTDELTRRIHEECHERGITLEQFEDVVGWRLSACMEPPEKLLEDMTLDALQWLCRELRIDWRRVLLSL